MRLIKSIGICLLLLLQFSSVSQALQHQWQWIESNDNFGFFLDTQTINPHYVEGDNADYADVWMMVKYSYEGARKELARYNNTYIKPEILQDGYAMYRLRLYFWSGLVQRNFTGFYKNDGTLLTQYTKTYESDVEKYAFYRPIMFYTIDYLTGNHEYAIYNHGKSYYAISNDKNVNGMKKYYISRNSIKSDGADIYFKCQKYDYNSNDEVQKKEICQLKYNTINNSFTYLSTDAYDDDSGLWTHSDFSVIPESKRKMSLVPDSFGEGLADDVKSFYQENKEFVNRYHQKLLPVRKKS